jgi:amino acid transporter
MGQKRCYCSSHHGWPAFLTFPQRQRFQLPWVPLIVALVFYFGCVGSSLPTGQVIVVKDGDNSQLQQQQQKFMLQHYDESNSSNNTFFVAVAAAVMGTVIIALLLWNARAIVAYIQRQQQRRWGQGTAAPAKVVVPTTAAAARLGSPGNNSLGFGSTPSAAALDFGIGSQSWVAINDSSSGGQMPDPGCTSNHTCQSHISKPQLKS